MFQLRRTRLFLPKMGVLFIVITGLFYISSPIKSSDIVQTTDNPEDAWDFLEQFENTWNKRGPNGCPERVILLNNKGRLGNKILEYIGTRIFAVYQGQNFYVRPDMYQNLTKFFTNIGAIEVEKPYLNRICNITDENWTEVSLESFIDYAVSGKDTPRFTEILGYPLNVTIPAWGIMLENKDLFLKEFQWKDEITQLIQKRKKQLTRNRTYSKLVGVHVRRTDFFQHLNSLYGPSRLAERDYFIKAMNIYKVKYGNPLFMVISDDLEWCKANLAAEDVVFAGEGSEETPGHDLALLSSFDHLILSYGTFAITAAYFSGAEVIIGDKYSTIPDDINERLKRVKMLSHWKWLPVFGER